VAQVTVIRGNISIRMCGSLFYSVPSEKVTRKKGAATFKRLRRFDGLEHALYADRGISDGIVIWHNLFYLFSDPFNWHANVVN
jgi:hypothetical protein